MEKVLKNNNQKISDICCGECKQPIDKKILEEVDKGIYQQIIQRNEVNIQCYTKVCITKPTYMHKNCGNWICDDCIKM